MPTALENVFYNNTTIRTEVGCTIEYNMNLMIDGITVTSATADSSYINGITDWSTDRANPFKKLFPVDAIIKGFRPLYPGAKYFIMSEPDNTYLPFRTVSYTGEGKNANESNAKPRIYYPGITTSYKYWLSAKDADVDLTVRYLQTSTTWTAAGKYGNIPAGNKAALANKIVVSFEKFHALPTQYRITVTPVTGSAITTTYAAPSSTGVINHYWNGTNWSTTSISEPYSFSEPQSIRSIRLEATNPDGGKYVGVIEVSARWVKDISSDIVTFDINKEASSSSEDILPVGSVTANSFDLQLAKYNQSALQIINYNRDAAWTTSPTIANAIYMVKNAELRPYFKIFHSSGVLGTSPNQYDKDYQGTYFIESWSIDELGETNLLAIDGSKYLMETLCPDLLCEDFPVTAILRNLLDSIGFTNYNFNLAANETSIPQVKYWWTKDSDTIWGAIQELCRDIQMNAVFDDDNVLQFYSRDYLYDASRSASWNFYYSQEGSALPNIVDFNKKEIASANMVKVLWQTPLTSNYVGTSGFLWESPTSFLSAGALKQAITANSDEFIIEISATDTYSIQQSFYNFAGYILVDAEIIEFDAIGYDLTPLSGSSKEHVWISSESDVSKYRSLALPGYEDPLKPAETSYFKPSGRYRVKEDQYNNLVGRGALGTKAAAHAASVAKLDGWTGRLVTQV
jgi:hypothetical protein